MQFKAGNITADETIALLEQLNTAVFRSSGTAANAYDPYSCNLNGLSTYQHCPFVTADATELFHWNHHHETSHHSHDAPEELRIRGVALVGALVSAPWAGGLLTYTATDDFLRMRQAGLNTVLLPVPVDDAHFWTPTHGRVLHEQKKKQASPSRNVHDLFDLLEMAQDAKLRVVLEFVGKEQETLDKYKEIMVQALSMVMKHHASQVLLGVQLPSLGHESAALAGYAAWIAAARRVSSHLPLFVPVNIGQLAQLKVRGGDEKHHHIYTGLSMDHTTAIADIASSNSLDDRMKLYYHENVACTERAPIDYVACYKGQPALITAGFDAAIDNCAFQNDHTVPFVDYGQCSRWEETVGSPWWERHRQSFVVRQLASLEQGLGWIFAAWKVQDDSTEPPGVIATPAQLHSFTAVSAAGIFPNLHSYVAGQNDWDDLPACLNPPLDDFILGDDTLAPVPAPPPDCGNGWWNYTIQDCSYWVPPPPPPPCPVCELCNETADETDAYYPTYSNASSFSEWSNSSFDAEESLELNGMIEEGRMDGLYGVHHVGLAFVAGMLLTTMVLGLAAVFVNGKRRRRDGYAVVPNSNH